MAASRSISLIPYRRTRFKILVLGAWATYRQREHVRRRFSPFVRSYAASGLSSPHRRQTLRSESCLNET
jgi:hypothetical protein